MAVASVIAHSAQSHSNQPIHTPLLHAQQRTWLLAFSATTAKRQRPGGSWPTPPPTVRVVDCCAVVEVAVAALKVRATRRLLSG